MQKLEAGVAVGGREVLCGFFFPFFCYGKENICNFKGTNQMAPVNVVKRNEEKHIQPAHMKLIYL